MRPQLVGRAPQEVGGAVLPRCPRADVQALVKEGGAGRSARKEMAQRTQEAEEAAASRSLASRRPATPLAASGLHGHETASPLSRRNETHLFLRTSSFSLLKETLAFNLRLLYLDERARSWGLPVRTVNGLLHWLLHCGHFCNGLSE
jgi:hypothetical protein